MRPVRRSSRVGGGVFLLRRSLFISLFLAFAFALALVWALLTCMSGISSSSSEVEVEVDDEYESSLSSPEPTMRSTSTGVADVTVPMRALLLGRCETGSTTLTRFVAFGLVIALMESLPGGGGTPKRSLSRTTPNSVEKVPFVA